MNRSTVQQFVDLLEKFIDNPTDDALMKLKESSVFQVISAHLKMSEFRSLMASSEEYRSDVSINDLPESQKRFYNQLIEIFQRLEDSVATTDLAVSVLRAVEFRELIRNSYVNNDRIQSIISRDAKNYITSLQTWTGVL